MKSFYLKSSLEKNIFLTVLNRNPKYHANSNEFETLLIKISKLKILMVYFLLETSPHNLNLGTHKARPIMRATNDKIYFGT